jgi:natural product precursor
MKKTKKLVLSAETIRQLSDRDLRAVMGGGAGDGAARTWKCPTSDPASENSCGAAACF